MKIAVVSYKKELILPMLKKYGHRTDNKNPEIVIALGGDGTFLYSEEKYPGIPKVFIYHSSTCPDCSIHNFSQIIANIEKLPMITLPKIEAHIGKKKIIALNDINIHYIPPRALRFCVKVDGRTVADKIIGDGIVIATPLGSNAYFKSITGRDFTKGIGIAFNNTTKRMHPMILPDSAKIEVEILRENGIIAHDTCNKLVKIKKGDKIIIIKSDSCTKAVKFKKG
jgi:NAD kinase